MTRAQQVAHPAGFTLVELLIIVAIIGIVASVAAVNMVRQMPRYRLTSAATQMAWTLRSLRMRAVSQHHKVTITFTNNAGVYTIWTDSNDNGNRDLAPCVGDNVCQRCGEVQTCDISVTYNNVRFTSTTNPTFNPTGTVTNPPLITLTNSSSGAAKTLTMNIIGDVKVQ